MKIRTKKLPYSEVIKIVPPVHKKPIRPSSFFRFLMRALGHFDLKAVDFDFTADLGPAKDSPCLILMNHSSFIDLEIAAEIFKDKPYCIVCTADGFVGKNWLMRHIGCIPTKKFVSDFTLLKDIKYALKKLNTSVLMYPEASYSFDGRATALPRGLGKLIRMLSVPVVMVKTNGAFLRDPLYNCLQKRKVKVSASARCIITHRMINEMSDETLEKILDDEFTFDYFAEQEENNIQIKEPFRADGLERIIYRCPHCLKEGCTVGKGTYFLCNACNKSWYFDEYSRLRDSAGTILRVPQLYDLQRQAVANEIKSGTFSITSPVNIGVMVDFKSIYMVGSGTLDQSNEGFCLTGCDGQLLYKQSALSSYSLYSDFYWYEIGDVICIGNNDILYYCFPEKKGIVAKARIAAEELYKIKKQEKLQET